MSPFLFVTTVGSGGNYGNYNGGGRKSTWTDGTPTASGTNDGYYVWSNGSPNSGWEFTVPADATNRTLYVYAGVYKAQGTLTATLSDGSSAPVTLSQTHSDFATSVYAINYKAASANQTLKIKYTKTAENGWASGGSADLIGAWLTGTPQQAAYGGTPTPVPGTVQAENFDTGGEGVAYHDSDGVNNGGAYRTSEGVDINANSGDAGGTPAVGFVKAGEWIEYTVNVASAGTYTFDARVASSGQGGTIHMEVEGADKTGSMTIPNTGSWTSWQTISKQNVTLGAGVQVVRIKADTEGPNGWVGDLNWFKFTQTSVSNQPPTVATPAAASPSTVTGQTTTLSVLGADDRGEAGLTYQWTTTAKPSSATPEPTFSANGTNAAKNATVTFLAPGVYTFDVTITDGPNSISSSTASNLSVDVTVDWRPSVTVTGPSSGTEGSPLTYTASAADPSGNNYAMTYAWLVTKDGQPFTLPGGTTTNAASFTFTPPDDGNYVAAVGVTSAGGARSVAKNAAVGNVSPNVLVTRSPAGNVSPGTAVSFTASVSDPGPLDTHSYAWTITKDGQPFATAATSSYAFTPTTPGSYVVGVVVTDNDSAYGSDSDGVQVGLTAPAGLTATANQDGTVSLAWSGSGVSGHDGYRVTRWNEDGSFTEMTASGTSLTDGSAPEGSELTYEVTSYLGSYTSSASESVTVQTILKKPTGLSAQADDAQHSIGLTWVDGSSNESGFEIEASTGGAFEAVGTAAADATQFTLADAEEGITYQFRVRAYRNNGITSGYSNTSSATTALSAPGGTEASAVRPSEVNLTWTDESQGETGFRIDVKTGDGEFAALVTVAPSADESPYERGFAVTGLSPDTDYAFRVLALRGSVESEYGESATVRTPEEETLPGAVLTWSNGTGPFYNDGNDHTTLTISNLPPGEQATIRLDFGMHSSWDGRRTGVGEQNDAPVGPDMWTASGPGVDIDDYFSVFNPDDTSYFGPWSFDFYTGSGTVQYQFSSSLTTSQGASPQGDEGWTIGAAVTQDAGDEFPVVSIAVTDSDAVEAADDQAPADTDFGEFTITRDGGDTSEALTVLLHPYAGTAVNGVDFGNLDGSPLPNSVTIPAGETSVEVKVKALEDDIDDASEFAQLFLKASENYSLAVVVQGGPMNIQNTNSSKSVASVEWVPQNTATSVTKFDSNPHLNGGKRLFPDQDLPTDVIRHDLVDVVATITPTPPAGTTVYFQSYDVDDPNAFVPGQQRDQQIDKNDTSTVTRGLDNSSPW